MHRLCVLLVAAFLCAPTGRAWADLSVASFNIRIYSNGSRDDAELELIADRLLQFDLIAVQEVRDEEVIARTLRILSRRGHDYQAMVSPPVGRGVKERYAFIWRVGSVAPLASGTVVPDPGDLFIREPYYASFRAGAFDFTLITMHAVYGDRVGDRRAEALLLDDVYRAVQDADPAEQDVILLGDFNLPPEDPGFVEVDSALDPVFTGAVRTSISDASLYDNFWWDPRFVTEWTGEAGIDRFDETVFGNNDDAASLAVSDHRPIWVTFTTEVDDDEGAPTAVGRGTWGGLKNQVSPPAPTAKSAPATTQGKINLNTASQAELETLWGVGPTIARRIIAGRPYKSVDDLERVSGIGPKKMARIRPLVSVR